MKRHFQEEIINLPLDYESEFDSTLAGIRNEPSQLKKNFDKLGSELAVSRGGSRTAATSKMERFVIIKLTIITKPSILDVAAVLDPPLVSNHVNGMLDKRVINMERQCWSNNLEVTGIPNSTESKDLEETVLKVFEKLEVMVELANVEDSHSIKTSNGSKKVIIKLLK